MKVTKTFSIKKIISRSKASDHRKKKLFISHSQKDLDYIKALVKLLESIGLNTENVVCSSIPGYNVPLSKDIYNWLQEQFQEYDLYVLFVLSDYFYASAACLNEMGAAWVLRSTYASVLLPGFQFDKMKGAINPDRIAINLGAEREDINHLLNEFEEELVTFFELNPSKTSVWERHRNEFVNKVRELKNREYTKEGTSAHVKMKLEPALTKDAIWILLYAATSVSKSLSVLNNSSGVVVQIGDKTFGQNDSKEKNVRIWKA